MLTTVIIKKVLHARHCTLHCGFLTTSLHGATNERTTFVLFYHVNTSSHHKRIKFHTLGWYWTRIKQACRIGLLFSLLEAFFATSTISLKVALSQPMSRSPWNLLHFFPPLGFCSFYWVFFHSLPHIWSLEVTLVRPIVSYTAWSIIGGRFSISDSRDKINCLNYVHSPNSNWSLDPPASICQVFEFCKPCTSMCYSMI